MKTYTVWEMSHSKNGQARKHAHNVGEVTVSGETDQAFVSALIAARLMRSDEAPENLIIEGDGPVITICERKNIQKWLQLELQG